MKLKSDSYAADNLRVEIESAESELNYDTYQFGRD